MPVNSLPPWVIQVAGLALGLFFVVFWVITGRAELSLIGFAGTLVSIGTVARARKALRDDKEAEE